MWDKESIEPILEAKHITKRFPASNGRSLLACNDVTLTAYRGKTLGIVGESGCGKSTFVKMIVRMVEPTEGEILVDGVDITKLKGEALRQSRRKVQMVFQDPSLAFNPRMRIIDILTEPLLNFGLITPSQKEEKAKELLNMVELPADFCYRYPHNMSGGQRQRIGLARALSLEPEILICDEATAALDVSVQDKIVKLLCTLQQEKGITILFICHDIALVQSLAHQVAVMYLGKVMEVLPGEAFGTEALHPYSKALMGSLFSTRMDFSKQIESIESEAPSPVDTPPGCPFQNRCDRYMEVCRRESPPLVRIEEGHEVACHLFPK